MLESGEEIIEDIDATLEQLTQNAAALKVAKTSHHFDHEVENLERLQESLLARLMHRQSLLKMEQKQKTLESIRKETIERKVVDYARSLKSRRQRTRGRLFNRNEKT
ncbi:MAG: hypothetical protein KR126chlam3_00595 [Chlamydiae bacterium]|nr:hypothetical protein [Chlamydiota bacterium]